MKFKVQAIEWVDAAHSDKLYDYGEGVEVFLLTEIGAVVCEDERRVVIASEVNFEDGFSRHQVSIPKECIRRRRNLGTIDHNMKVR